MKHLSGKEKKQLVEKIPQGFTIDKKDEIVFNHNCVISKNGEPYLIFIENQYLPHLRSIDESPNSIPSVYIDKGAIPFLLKGADMMLPGIQKIEGAFDKNDIVIIRDENHAKPLGIGFALMNRDEMKTKSSGKAVSPYHYVNDNFY